MDAYIDYECPNCGTKMTIPEWLFQKSEKEDNFVYCSAECKYNAETGHPGEEY